MSKPQRIVTSSTHYWCEYCLKFIKNTAVDRKNHENGVPHQEAKAKKVAQLRSASPAVKLEQEIAQLEKAANSAIRADAANFSPAHSEYSTYTPSTSVEYLPKLPPTAPTAPVSSGEKKASDSPPAPEEAEATPVPEASKEAGLPGKWEVVEEVDDEDVKEETDEEDHKNSSDFGFKSNLKKRDRYAETESALEQMEEESRILASSTKAERVPEIYRAGAPSSSTDPEPMFKVKTQKGGNIKKRVKQL